ncbi:YfcC family protein [Alkalihalobacillus sp. TS-13]|uniref:YfcC family protein n=1 Tax=Alkalihalobacillus sp. TS-13 TaxID=2842455 RepID=UPI001C86BCF6|nr:SLC13 family permease [Alkalihalobacillus sp. TS-13]
MEEKSNIETNDVQESKKNKKFPMPDVFVILFSFLLIAYALSYIIPSGSYERVERGGITQIDPNSFQYVKSESLSIMDLFLSIVQGLSASADIVFLILIVGGTLALIESSGAFKAGIGSLIRLTRGNYLLLLVTFSSIFAVLSTFGVGANIVIAFVPIGIIIARSLKLDPVVGVALVFLGSYSGWAGGVFDPIVTVFAQSIAELPLFSGVLFRLVIFVIFVSITIFYICLYAKKVRHNPANSLMGPDYLSQYPDYEDKESVTSTIFTTQQKIILLLFVTFLGIYLYGAFNLKWNIKELSAIFIMLGIAVAIVSRTSPNQFVNEFMKGITQVIYGALVVGLARAVIILLENGRVIDTVVNGTTATLDMFPPVVSMQLLYFFNLFFNSIITSGTGQAAIVMPIMVPIVDMLDVTRQVAFITFKLGDAITNIITPLSGTLMACLALGKVSYGKWLKFIFPLFLIWTVIGAILVGIAVVIQYGPY